MTPAHRHCLYSLPEFQIWGQQHDVPFCRHLWADLADRPPCFNDGTRVILGMHQQQEQQEAPSQRVVVGSLRTHAGLKYHILFW